MTTAHDIATTIAADHDLSADVAAESVAYHIALMEFLGYPEIDRNAIDRLDAGMIEILIAVEQHKGRNVSGTENI